MHNALRNALSFPDTSSLQSSQTGKRQKGLFILWPLFHIEWTEKSAKILWIEHHHMKSLFSVSVSILLKQNLLTVWVLGPVHCAASTNHFTGKCRGFSRSVAVGALVRRSHLPYGPGQSPAGLPWGLFLISTPSLCSPIQLSSLRDSTGVCALPPEGINPIPNWSELLVWSLCVFVLQLWLLEPIHTGLEEGLRKGYTDIFGLICTSHKALLCLTYVLGVYGVISVETYGSLPICFGPGGGEVETGGGKNTQMGNELVHLSWENAFQSFKQQPSLWKKRLFFPAVMPKEKINLKWKSE